MDCKQMLSLFRPFPGKNWSLLNRARLSAALVIDLIIQIVGFVIA